MNSCRVLGLGVLKVKLMRVRCCSATSEICHVSGLVYLALGMPLKQEAKLSRVGSWSAHRSSSLTESKAVACQVLKLSRKLSCCMLGLALPRSVTQKQSIGHFRIFAGIDTTAFQTVRCEQLLACGDVLILGIVRLT